MPSLMEERTSIHAAVKRLQQLAKSLPLGFSRRNRHDSGVTKPSLKELNYGTDTKKAGRSFW
jgi:hypothetical protein